MKFNTFFNRVEAAAVPRAVGDKSTYIVAFVATTPEACITLLYNATLLLPEKCTFHN